MSDSVRTHGLQPTRLLHSWDFPGKSTGMPSPSPHPSLGFPMAQMIKNLPAMQETWIWSLQKGMATHSSVPAWRIAWTEKPGGLQSMGLHGQRSLVDCGPWGCMDGEAWWTAVHGVEEPDTSTFTPVWSLPQTLLVLPYGTSVPTSVQAHYCSALSTVSFAWSLTPADVQMANRHEKRCSTSLIVKRHANQNYNQVSPHIGQMAIIKKSTNNKCWRGFGEKGILLHCWWECKLLQPFWFSILNIAACTCESQTP